MAEFSLRDGMVWGASLVLPPPALLMIIAARFCPAAAGRSRRLRERCPVPESEKQASACLRGVPSVRCVAGPGAWQTGNAFVLLGVPGMIVPGLNTRHNSCRFTEYPFVSLLS